MTDAQGIEIKSFAGVQFLDDPLGLIWTVSQIRRATIVVWRTRPGYRARRVEKATYPSKVRVVA